MSNNASIELSAREHSVAAAPIAAQADHAVYAPPPNFASHLQSASDGSGIKSSPGPATLPHGYSNHAQIPQSEAHIHPELRSSHESPPTTTVYAPIPNMIQPGTGVPHTNQAVAMSGPPAVVAQALGPVSPGDSADGRKAKRELSQSKRAAQNRAAQRAFRQRKEGYIKKLEQQVRDYGEMESTFKSLQAENYALRDYVLRLQSRLLDAQGEYPQPPPGITLAHPAAQGQPSHGGPEVPQPTGAAGPGQNQVEVAAQAVAGLTRGEHLGGRDPYAPVRTDDDRTAEEITRQLQADGGPDGLPAAPM